MTNSKPSSQDAQSDALDQLRHLRELIVEPRLSDLRQQVEGQQIDSEKLSEMLPDAIRRSSADGDRLAKAIQPTFSTAFSESVKRNPKALADAVSPIMGPAIQRYIKQQIQAMIQSLNTTLDQSLSAKSFGWRFEAWKTGKPFGEIVLLHTLIYRIEQVLLIDPDTGLLMQSASQGQQDDADLVSSLLSAIQDFMRDSFRHQSESGSELQDMKTNELTVWIHHGSAAVLAVAIRGQAPISLREKIQGVLDELHVEYSSLLENFSGDTSTLDVVRPELEDLIESEFVGAKTPKTETQAAGKADANDDDVSNRPWWQQQLTWAVPTAILLAMGAWFYARQQKNYYEQVAQQLDLPPSATMAIDEGTVRIGGSVRHSWLQGARNRLERLEHISQLDVESDIKFIDQPWVDYVNAIKAEPGLTVLESRRTGGKYYLYGLRDTNAKDPAEILRHIGLKPGEVIQHWANRQHGSE